MSDPFDQIDLTPAPAEPERRRLFSVGFWAMMALCLLCVLAGAAMVAFGPMFTGHGSTPSPSPPAASPAAAASPAPAPSALAGPASDAAIAV
ncbi:MAG: hypothetical protein JSR86_17830, partial [Proteobacteria bacterium]|nr:hypothetical protein [Pseudomonadota bacterium]